MRRRISRPRLAPTTRRIARLSMNSMMTTAGLPSTSTNSPLTNNNFINGNFGGGGGDDDQAPVDDQAPADNQDAAAPAASDNSGLSVNQLYTKALNYKLFAGSFKEFASIYNTDPNQIIGNINQWEDALQQGGGDTTQGDDATTDTAAQQAYDAQHYADPSVGVGVVDNSLANTPATNTTGDTAAQQAYDAQHYANPNVGTGIVDNSLANTPAAPTTPSFGQSLSDSLSKNLFGTLGGLVTTGITAANQVQILKQNKKANAAGAKTPNGNTGYGAGGSNTKTPNSGISPLVYLGAGVALLLVIGGIALAMKNSGSSVVAAPAAPAAKK